MSLSPLMRCWLVVVAVIMTVAPSLITRSYQAHAKELSPTFAKKKIKIGKKTYNAHLMQMGEAATYLDESGNPLRLESGTTIMERG